MSSLKIAGQLDRGKVLADLREAFKNSDDDWKIDFDKHNNIQIAGSLWKVIVRFKEKDGQTKISLPVRWTGKGYLVILVLVLFFLVPAMIYNVFFVGPKSGKVKRRVIKVLKEQTPATAQIASLKQ